jgi:hypothetical protein
MPGKPTPRATLGLVVQKVRAYQTGLSPEKLVSNYPRGQSPLGASTIRRIEAGDPAEDLTSPDGELKLLKLDAMIRIAPGALSAVFALDRDALERMTFPGEQGEAVKQYILELMQQASGEQRRRVGDRR